MDWPREMATAYSEGFRWGRMGKRGGLDREDELVDGLPPEAFKACFRQGYCHGNGKQHVLRIEK